MRILRIGKPTDWLESVVKQDESIIFNNEWPDYPILDFVKLGVRNYGKVDYSIFSWDTIEESDKKKIDGIEAIREMTESKIIVEIDNIDNDDIINILEEKGIMYVLHGSDEEKKAQLFNIVFENGAGDIEEIKKLLQEKNITEDGPKIFTPINKRIAVLSWDAGLRIKICFQLLNYLLKIKSNCELVSADIDLVEMLDYYKLSKLEPFINSRSHEDSKTFTVLEAKSTAAFGKADIQIIVVNYSLQHIKKLGEFIMSNQEGFSQKLYILVDGCSIEQRQNVVDFITRTSNYYSNLDINFLSYNPNLASCMDIDIAKTLLGESVIGK